MSYYRQPASLLCFACKAVVDFVVQFRNCCSLSSEVHRALSLYLSQLPASLFNLWVKKFLVSLEKYQISSDLQFLAIKPNLETIDVDSFLKPDVDALSSCFSNNFHLKNFVCKYASFFWCPKETQIIRTLLLKFEHLLHLTLHHLNLQYNQDVLKCIGKNCRNLETLDLSYGTIPESELRAIPKEFGNLRSLILRQKTLTSPCINSVSQSVDILTSLENLTVFEDGTDDWSFVFPALHRLTSQSYDGNIALLQSLNVCQIFTVKAELVKSVKVLTLRGTVLKQSPPTLISWLQRSFPCLEILNLHAKQLPLSDFEHFLRVNDFIIKEVTITIDIDLIRTVSIIRNLLPHLTHLRISAMKSCANLREPDLTQFLRVGTIQPGFLDLKFLSYTGPWNECLANLLLSTLTSLNELHLKIGKFCLGSSLVEKCFPRLTVITIDHSLLDWNNTSQCVAAEVDFLEKIVCSAPLIDQVRLKFLTSELREILKQSLKKKLFNLEVL